MISQASKPIRVFLIDDHRSVLWGLEKLIESESGRMQVVGKATSWTDAVNLLGEHKPDVILLDLDLGKERGIEGIPELLSKSLARILVLTGVRDTSIHDQAVLAGARGVVAKEDSAETILSAIEKVHEGQLWLDRAATGRVFMQLSSSNGRGRETLSPEQEKISRLTSREKEIIAAVAAHPGENTKSLADRLHISEHTFRNHLTSIYEKLDLANRVELFAFAHKHQLTQNKNKD